MTKAIFTDDIYLLLNFLNLSFQLWLLWLRRQHRKTFRKEFVCWYRCSMAFTKVNINWFLYWSKILNFFFKFRTRYGISPENIILYGQSIGTVPTIDLASRYEVGAVILHSPLMSGMRVAFPNTKRTWFFDVFPRSVRKIFKNLLNIGKM